MLVSRRPKGVPRGQMRCASPRPSQGFPDGRVQVHLPFQRHRLERYGDFEVLDSPSFPSLE